MKATSKQSALLSDAIKALERMLKVYDALMPGVRYIAVQNYKELNEAPIEAQRMIGVLRRNINARN